MDEIVLIDVSKPFDFGINPPLRAKIKTRLVLREDEASLRGTTSIRRKAHSVTGYHQSML